MGIFCEISLFKPSDGVYKPGQTVSGVIKYNVDEPMEVDKVIMSLKGIGRIVLTSNPGKHESNFVSEESYVDIDTIIIDEHKEIAVGLYQIKFNYNLPQILPSTLKFFKYFPGYKVKCSIKYYIRIKFEKPGLFVFNNHFRKTIQVKSEVAPRLSREPVIYGETKNLTHLFSFSDSIVNIKATILNSAVPVGGKFEVHYEVQNNSQVVIKSIIVKLVEAYTFKAKGYHKVKYEEDIPGTETRTSSIECEDTLNNSIVVTAPSHIFSLSNAKIVARDFMIKIIAQLPLPHRNAVVSIPVQVGIFEENVDLNSCQQMSECVTYDDPPPSYWEAMGHTKKEDHSSDDEADEEKRRYL
ncbi:unnamed protein product [Arctia plantaginis]|uniref:Arrestin C-terminal-like domain-containing protein n=1 Tax=Arctia plantaginis TaxID=874455 RepID=A0A8S1A9X6_ARCPL|nr:unnamed protein product [Arctia plantaginis]